MAKCCYCENQLYIYSAKNEHLQTKEHLVPVSKGGLDVVQNIQPCCRRCNLWRLNYELEDWLYKVETEKRAIAPRYSLEVLDKITLNICKWVAYVDKHKSKLRDPTLSKET